MPRLTSVANFFRELRRRHVVRIAIAYAVTAWLLLQLAAIVLPTFDAPHWVLKVVIGLFILFFPVALMLAWAFEITPAGVRRTPPQAHPLVPTKNADMGGLLRSLATRKARRQRHSQAASPPGPTGSRASAAQSPPPATSRSPAAPHKMPRGAPRARAEGGHAARNSSLTKLRHDLRSPINAIVGYSEMLLEEGFAEDDQALADDVRKIWNAGKELQHFVDEVFAPESFRRHQGASREKRAAFAKDVDHRLRTPLNAVIGYSELLLEREKDSGHGAFTSDLEKIGRAGRQLLDQADAIIKFCAIEAEGEATDSDYKRVADIAREALDEFRGKESAGARGLIAGGALLVVDDNELNRELLAKRLALEGFTVSSAGSGEEALERLRSQPFDLILLDVVMPGLSGIEVLGEMKQDSELCDVPVIMISALDEVEAAVECIEAGAADYVTKPFEPVLLRARVAAALRTRDLALASRQNQDELTVREELMDRMLAGRFPESVARRVRSGETEFAERYDDVSVLCVQFLGLSVQATAGDALVGLQQLRAVRTWIRNIAFECGLETLIFRDLEALIAAGIPAEKSGDPATAAALALRILEEAATLKSETGGALRLRLGMHKGPVTAGIAGEESMSFEVWGETVEVARALASAGAANAIHVSAAVETELREQYAFENRGVADLGDHGQLRAYFLRSTNAIRA